MQGKSGWYHFLSSKKLGVKIGVMDLMPGAPHNAGKDGAGSIIAGKAGLYHS